MKKKKNLGRSIVENDIPRNVMGLKKTRTVS